MLLKLGETSGERYRLIRGLDLPMYMLHLSDSECIKPFVPRDFEAL